MREKLSGIDKSTLSSKYIGLATSRPQIILRSVHISVFFCIIRSGCRYLRKVILKRYYQGDRSKRILHHVRSVIHHSKNFMKGIEKCV